MQEVKSRQRLCVIAHDVVHNSETFLVDHFTTAVTCWFVSPTARIIVASASLPPSISISKIILHTGGCDFVTGQCECDEFRFGDSDLGDCGGYAIEASGWTGIER